MILPLTFRSRHGCAQPLSEPGWNSGTRCARFEGSLDCRLDRSLHRARFSRRSAGIRLRGCCRVCGTVQRSQNNTSGFDRTADPTGRRNRRDGNCTDLHRVGSGHFFSSRTRSPQDDTVRTPSGRTDSRGRIAAAGRSTSKISRGAPVKRRIARQQPADQVDAGCGACGRGELHALTSARR
jgi:hypothetical protein